MVNKLICENKYELSANDTIFLIVFLSDLPKNLEIQGAKLILKDSFHVSLVCIKEIIKKSKITDPNFRDSVLADFCDFVKTNEVALINYSNEFFFVEQGENKTVVVMCGVSNLDKFFELINKKYNLNLEYPPTHVTLYKLENGVGIFLTDASDLKDFTKPIPSPIGRIL
jgi:hypothetical protein